MPKILIVDDTQEIGMIVRETLEMFGMDVCQARDGEQAFLRFSRYRPDLVIMDVNMPRMDGWTATQMILSKYPSAKIIYLTGVCGEEQRQRAIETGAVGFYTKPFTPRELLSNVNHHLADSNWPAPASSEELPMRTQAASEQITQALAEVVGGFCHDLSNSLSAAQMCVELQMSKGKSSVDPRRLLEDAMKAVTTLHQFARNFYQRESGIEIVQFREVPETLRMMLPTISDPIALNTSVDWTIPTSQSIPALLLRHLVVPLVLNAQDALLEDECPEKTVDVSFALTPEMDAVEIVVADNGPGWRGLRPKLTEAFRRGTRISTKGDNRGHGLANIHRLVTKLGGTLNLEERESGGAAVRVRLPHML